jgi:four helix bundle protein
MGINSYKDLKAWQLSMDVVEHVYRLTQKFPKPETYGLSSQLQRAAV